MAEFELEMEDAGCDQGMHARLFQPAEDIGHHFGNVGRRSACVDKSIAVEHADIAAAETARFGEIMPTSSAISMQSVFIASLRSNGGSYGMARPFFTAIIIPPMALIRRSSDLESMQHAPSLTALVSLG